MAFLLYLRTLRAQSFLCALVVVGLPACGRQRIAVQGRSVLAESASALGPDAPPGNKAILRLGAPPNTKRGTLGEEFEVSVSLAKQGNDIVLKLVSNRELLEKEVYESRAEAFRVVAAGDDTFAPPLDLLRYPVREGASWDWEGKVVYAGISREARALVTVGRAGEDVRSDIALSIVADPGRPPLKRTFSFEFRKGHGIVRRAFGDVSGRRPVGEAWRP